MKFYGDENELCYSDAEDSHKPSGSSYTGGIGEFGQGHQSKNLWYLALFLQIPPEVKEKRIVQALATGVCTLF